jgi:HAE1 family hydrophobic/amphiphilic exporter-1
LRSYYTGTVATEYRERDNEYDIRVRLADSDKQDLDVLERLTVTTPSGEEVRISEVTARKRASGPNELFRKDRQHMIMVSGEVAAGTTVQEVYTEYDSRIRELRMPEGYSFEWAGEVELMQENFGDIYQALAIAIVLTYLMLSGILESWKLSVLIMLSLPLSFLGVFIGLLIRGSTLNIFSLMGMVMLVGLVINNAIVVLDYIIALRKDGMGLHDAILKGCKVRLRPLMMANLTTVVAMVPLALGMGAGGEYRAPMAVTQMGGIIAGGALALVVIPPLYYLVERRKVRKGKAKA